MHETTTGLNIFKLTSLTNCLCLSMSLSDKNSFIVTFLSPLIHLVQASDNLYFHTENNLCELPLYTLRLPG